MDELRDALSAAYAASETETTTSAPAPATTVAIDAPATSPEPSSTTTESAVVSDAKVATDKAEAGEVKTITDVVADKAPATDKVEDKAENKAADPRIDRAPASWKGDAKKVWAELPLSARQEVIRRERDTSRVLQESAQDRQRVAQIQEVLAPHMDRIREIHQGNPMNAITNLLGIERTLITGDTNSKAQLVANMINHFKIDVAMLDSILSGQAPSPESAQLSSVEQLISKATGSTDRESSGHCSGANGLRSTIPLFR